MIYGVGRRNNMSEIVRTKAELKEKLSEHIRLLVVLCDCFDKLETEVLATNSNGYKSVSA